jgi:hypothetical protein
MKTAQNDLPIPMQTIAATDAASPISHVEAAPTEAGVVKQSVTIRVNGKVQKIEVDTRATLLDTLREQLQLFGTKKAAITASVAHARST